MSIFNIFRATQKKNSASVAKERLQIIVAHQRNRNSSPEYLPQLQQELVDVISKYVKISKEDVIVDMKKDGDCSVLELNVSLPENVAESA